MRDIQIAAVLVLYNESLEESQTYKSLINDSLMPLFIYDNSPKSQKIKDNRYTYISNPKNPGVSKAYNMAWKWAKEKRYSHLLLLDSDSCFTKNALKVYQDELEKQPDSLIIPTMISNGRKISPFYFKFGKSHYGENIKPGAIEIGKIVAINSGLLIPISILDAVGGFNELLPLDWSDVFFMRSLKKLNVNAVHIDLIVKHSLSEHNTVSLESAKFRYLLQLRGIKIVASNFAEKILMLFWMNLRTLKLTYRYKSFWFLNRFLKH